MVFPSRFAAWARAGSSGPKDYLAYPSVLAGRPATYLDTFRPTALISPAGRCDGFSRRAVRPSKPLKTRRRYPWGLGASARLSTRGLYRGNRAFWLGRQHGDEHLEPDNAAVAIFLFHTTEIRDVQRSTHDQTSHQS